MRMAISAHITSLMIKTSTLLLALSAATYSVAQTEAVPKPSDEVIGLDAYAVTASRTLQPMAEIPQRIELITADTIQAVNSTYTYADILKKNSSADVIEYPSGLSGIGLRGFRPDYSGTNQHVLVLIDGHTTGATSLGDLGLLDLDRIEVLKGPASSMYGSSAMGGVVNFITKHSSGPISGMVSAGYGSFDTYEGLARIGGGDSKKIDFDVGLRTYVRDSDYRTGNGADLANTQLKNYSGSLRVGHNFSPDWRLDFDGSTFLSRDVENPGGLSYGNTNWSKADWDQYALNLRLTGTVGENTPQISLHRSFECYENYPQPVARSIYLSYLRNTNWSGISVQDGWQILPIFKVIGGVDYQLVKQDYKSYSSTGSGARIAPSSPNDAQTTEGYFLETVTKVLDDRLVFNAGARYDDIELKTRTTPYATTLTPKTSSFDTFNPRAGVVYRLTSNWRAHATAGRAFIAPTSSQTAGYYDQTVGSQRQVTTGNPNLKPESSKTWDAGVGCDYPWIAADLTYFHTTVQDKITTIYPTNTPSYRESTYVNANSAKQNGVEAEIDVDFSRLLSAAHGTWQLNFSATKMIDRTQVISGAPSVITNVADFKFNTGISWHQGPWRARLSTRYVHGMWDNDYTTKLIYTNGKGGIFEYASFTVWDAYLARQFGKNHEVSLNVDNLFDRYYYEKNDYPQPGIGLFARYRFTF